MDTYYWDLYRWIESRRQTSVNQAIDDAKRDRESTWEAIAKRRSDEHATDG